MDGLETSDYLKETAVKNIEGEITLGEGRAAEIDREFKKAVAERLELYWKDIQAYERGGFWARLRVQIKYTFRDRSAECDVPKYVLQAIVDDMMPDIRASLNPRTANVSLRNGKNDAETVSQIIKS